MKFLSILSFMLMLSACADLGSQAKQQSARALAEMMFSQQSYDGMINTLKAGSLGSIAKDPRLADEGAGCVAVLEGAMLKHINSFTSYDGSLDAVASFYAENYSKSEIDDLQSLFKTPLGEALMAQTKSFEQTNKVDYTEILSDPNLLTGFMEYIESDLGQKTVKMLPKMVQHMTTSLRTSLFGGEAEGELKKLMFTEITTAMSQGKCTKTSKK